MRIFEPSQGSTYNGLMSPFVLYQPLLDWPTDWANQFGRTAPFVVEIGFGNGQFLVDLAKRRPSQNILGIEISIPSMQRAEHKIKNANLENVRLLQADARFFLQLLCPEQSIAEVYVNFPDPWRKAAHHDRRLISESFLHLLATRMVSGGELDIATDHADYQNVITEALQKTPYFSSRMPTPYVTQDSERLVTKYEQKALTEGRVCRYFKWQRNETEAQNIFLPPKEFDMPHVVLQTAVSLTQMQKSYQPMHASDRNVHVKLTEMFRSNDGKKLFVEAYVNEHPLAQRVGLLVREREEGEYIILLHEVGFPRSTYGLHLAIATLSKWILNLENDGQVLKSNLQVPLGENTAVSNT